MLIARTPDVLSLCCVVWLSSTDAAGCCGISQLVTQFKFSFSFLFYWIDDACS
jgi:hypothetical protein